MSLGQYLRDIADGYSRSSIQSASHGLLAQEGDRLTPLLPAGLKVEDSGGKGVATWVAAFCEVCRSGARGEHFLPRVHLVTGHVTQTRGDTIRQPGTR